MKAVLHVLLLANFGGGKFWQINAVLPNSPKFSATKILHYTV